MLIGIDASRANKLQKTGVEWYSYHLIEQFKKMDQEDRFFLYTNEPLRGPLAVKPRNFEEKVLNWPIPKTWTLSRLSYEMKFAKEIPDVLFVPAHTIPLLNPRRSVVTIHDIGFEHFKEGYKFADRFYHKFIIHFIKRFASRIITVSNFCKDDIVKTYGIPAEKISVVHNGFDNLNYRFIENAKEKLKEKYKIDFPFVNFVGRLELKKNTPRLVEAFGVFKQKHPENKHKLILIGRKGFCFEAVEQKIREYSLNQDVVFPGYVVEEDMPLFHSASDLFIFPSLFEGFGIPVLEAMACRVPVICSNTTSLPEVAGEAALQFDPQNITQMVARMEQVLFNPEVSESLRIKGIERAKLFSWEKCARETLKIVTGNW